MTLQAGGGKKEEKGKNVIYESESGRERGVEERSSLYSEMGKIVKAWSGGGGGHQGSGHTNT